MALNRLTIIFLTISVALMVGGCAARSGVSSPFPSDATGHGLTEQQTTTITEDFIQAQKDRKRWGDALEKWMTSANHVLTLDTCKDKFKVSKAAFAACDSQQDDDLLTASQDAKDINQRLAHDADVLDSDGSASEYPAMGLYAKSLRRCVEATKQDFDAFFEEYVCNSQANKLSKQE